MPQFLYPQIGILIWTPLVLAFAVAVYLVTRGLLKRHFAGREAYLEKRRRWDDDPKYALDDSSYGMAGVMVAVLGGIVSVGALIGVVIGLLPFNPSYWGVYSVQGRVAGISNQLSTHDGDISGIYYTVALEGSSKQLYTSDDTRLSSVKAGDELGLKCVKVWHFQAVDSWECDVRNFGFVGKDSDR